MPLNSSIVSYANIVAPFMNNVGALLDAAKTQAHKAIPDPADSHQSK
jgi:hypothetical protein